MRLLVNIVNGHKDIALIEFNIVDRFLEVQFGLQVSLATTIGPRAIRPGPLAAFSQVTRGM